jgi:hypothetical protein
MVHRDPVIANTIQGSIMADDPFAWFKDQASLIHWDQRFKKASRERLECASATRYRAIPS